VYYAKRSRPVLLRFAVFTQKFFNSFPAFIACHVEDDSIVIDQAISSSNNSILTKDEIKLWLIQSGIIQNKLVETPNP